MEFKQLHTFVEVVRHGSFAGAARQIDAAPSVVTRAIAALEDELGVRLLQRTTRRLALTEAGAAFHDRVKRLLEDAERAGDEARAATGRVQGRVRVTAPVGFGQAVIVPLLGALHERHPGLDLELQLTDTVVDLLAEPMDLALRLGPPADSQLVGQRLVPIRYRVCASPGYLARHGRPEAPAGLSERACIRFATPAYRSQWRFRRPGDASQVPEAVEVGGWLVLSSAPAVHRAALDGLGPALLADLLVAPDLASGALVDMFPQWEASVGDFDAAVWMLYPSRVHVPGRVRAFIDFLKDALAGGPVATEARAPSGPHGWDNHPTPAKTSR